MAPLGAHRGPCRRHHHEHGDRHTDRGQAVPQAGASRRIGRAGGSTPAARQIITPSTGVSQVTSTRPCSSSTPAASASATAAVRSCERRAPTTSARTMATPATSTAIPPSKPVPCSAATTALWGETVACAGSRASVSTVRKVPAPVPRHGASRNASSPFSHQLVRKLELDENRWPSAGDGRRAALVARRDHGHQHQQRRRAAADQRPLGPRPASAGHHRRGAGRQGPARPARPPSRRSPAAAGRRRRAR